MGPLKFSGPLRTERLTLRLMTPADADAVAAYQGDPEVCRYLPYEPRGLDEMTDKLISRAAEPQGAGVLAVEGDSWLIAVETRGRVVGEIFFALRSLDNRTAEIGWVFHPASGGQGYATEAAAAMVDLAFGDLDLHRVIAQLDPANSASVALCRRLGMRHEALFRQDEWIKGAWADTAVYGLLAEEWYGRDVMANVDPSPRNT